MMITMHWHRRHVAKISARRERNRLATAWRRWPTAAPERAKKREALRDLYELGLESTPSKAGFPEAPKGRVKKTAKRRRASERRAAATYRGARGNALRATAAQRLKAERLARGETRAQADRRRQQAALA